MKVPLPTGLNDGLRRGVARVARKVGMRQLAKLTEARGRLSEAFSQIPANMEKVAKQTALMLELVDDVRQQRYRKVPWWVVAVISGALLYAISPADLVPEVIPFLGQLDDMALVAIATRAVQKELRRYCAFKGYSEAEYF